MMSMNYEAHLPRYTVVCDDCKCIIGRTDSERTSHEGGICINCKIERAPNLTEKARLLGEYGRTCNQLTANRLINAWEHHCFQATLNGDTLHTPISQGGTATYNRPSDHYAHCTVANCKWEKVA